MPLQKLIFKPGVNREGTTLTNEGSWFETDKVRFRSGFPEKIGGWAAISTNRFLGVCRSMWNWITLKNFNLLGLGTNQKFYVENGGNYYDITPLQTTPGSTVSSIQVTSGSYVATITVASSPSFQTGDIVQISGIVSPIGGVDASVFNQQYFITYISGSIFTIRMRQVSALESPLPYVTAGSNATASGLTAPISYLLPSGLPIYTIGTGWGVGPWSPYVTVTLTDPFTAAGIGVSTLIVNDPSHGLTTGDGVTFASIASDPCGINKTVMIKSFTVTVVDPNNYTISTVMGSAPGPVFTYVTTSTAASGGTVVLQRRSTNSARRGWGAGYTTGSGTGLQMRLWSQANYGEDLIINPRGGALYLWSPGAGATPAFGSRAAIISGTDVPDQVNEVMVSDATRIVIALGCSDYDPPIGTGLFDPMLIRWSTNENYLDWTPSITDQAGSYRLSHGSEIITGLQTRQEILIWTDAALYSMQYLGPPYVWGFNILADNISIISPNAVATANGMVFWMGTDKFYMYAGRVETLPSALRQYVFQDINKDQGYQVYAGTNEGYSEVWWFYCSKNSNIIDRYVIFNYLDNVWYYGGMQRTAWLDSAARQYPQAAYGSQDTLLAANINDVDTEILVGNSSSFPKYNGYIQIGDEIIFYEENSGTSFLRCVRGVELSTPASHSIDDPVTQYGANLVVSHEFGNDDASATIVRSIESFIQSSDIDLDDGDRYMFVWQMVPDFSFDGSTTPSPEKPQVQVQLRPRQNPGANYSYGQDPTVESAQNYGGNVNTYTVQEFTELVNTRIRGRQVALRISSDQIGTKWQLGALRINMRPDGRK